MGKGKDEPKDLVAPVLHLHCASVPPVSQAEHGDGVFLGVLEPPAALGKEVLARFLGPSSAL